MTLISEPITFSPRLQADDAIANYWLRQVTLRLRREISWRWYQHGYATPAETVVLPPLEDGLSKSLDLSRYEADKAHFFQTDVTGHYLTEQLQVALPERIEGPRGSFGWVVQTLPLDAAAAFVLALGLTATFDPAAAAVIATCQNSPAATQPTLAIAQHLWEHPEAMLAIADRSHPLWRYGLLQAGTDAPIWQRPLSVAPLIARQLLFPDQSLPDGLILWSSTAAVPRTLMPEGYLVANRLRAVDSKMNIVPVRGPQGTSPQETIQGIAQLSQRPVVALRGAAALCTRDDLTTLMTLCWLKGFDVYLPERPANPACGERQTPYAELQPLAELPIAVFLQIRDRKQLESFPSDQVLPILELPRLSYCDRIQTWYNTLGIAEATASPALQQAIAECARRFRYEPETIRRIAQSLGVISPTILPDLATACRAEMDLDIGDLAQAVTPRFSDTELVLPPKQHQQFQEIYQAMTALTEVHYQWGTARAWNECGISVLFAGPPGTGKTMAAEALAAKLNLSMYRIDLSQVVNKYIGETEKNLKRLFDTADRSDTVLFFDEADALFGRRTEVKDAHDRYANLEISYLLERMERFKGLAILATNRQKDLDEAFLRRLRYIVEFPLPEERERKRIWQQVMPTQVNATQLDVDFLARQFPLAGGHIRSIVFNACLQTAGMAESIGPPVLTMERVIVAIKREYDKLNRSVSQSQFGPYAPLVQRIDHV